jgi:Protein of unknown function (DUF3014)
MPNLDDIDLQPSTSHDFDLRTPGSADPPEEGRRPSVWVALAILAALIGAVAYFIYGRQPLPPEQAAESRPARTQAPPPAPPAEPLPALDASDALIRQLVASFSSHPELASWLATPDLVRTFVAIVDKIAIGASPAKNAAFARPKQPFQVSGSGATVQMSQASYDRFNTLASVIDSVNIDGAAKAYARIKPLCEQAYRDLGYPDGDFDKKMSLAIARLLDTPVPDGPVELRATSVTYQFADPDLESLSSGQKQLLRMGPRNMRIVQAKLREFVKATGL